MMEQFFFCLVPITLHSNYWLRSNKHQRKPLAKRLGEIYGPFVLNREDSVLPGQLIVVKGVKQTNQIACFRRSRHLIGFETVPVRIELSVC